MAKPTDDGEGGKRGIASAVRAPLIITIVVIAVIGAAYYAFYRNQVDYYTGRNLRLMSTLTAQINGRVSTYSGFFRDGILKPDGSPAKGQEIPVEPIVRSVAETTRGWAVKLQSQNGLMASVPIEDVLRPIFARRVGAAFDMVLVADAKGDVLYSLRTPPPTSSLLTNEEESLEGEEKELNPKTAATIRSMNRQMKERQSGSALVITRLGALLQRKGWREYTSLNPATLLVGTEQIRVRLGDAEYLLFAQPYVFARQPVSADGVAKPWIVCGLVSAPRFRYDVSAVSASVVLTAVGLALLALCCWPFLRIALIHPSQELTIGDVALIVICTAAGASVLTLAVLDVFAYRTLAAEADEQLHEFSKTVVKDFSSNVRRAMEVLNQAVALNSARLSPADKSRKSMLLPPELLDTRTVGRYPYIDSISWIDKLGSQQARFAAQEQNLVPLTEVGQRQYFRNALFERTWTVDGQPYVLDWVRSRATGEVRAFLATKTDNPDRPVVALSTELIDVTYAVRPPGVEMAIVDENGEVVYHSDVERIGFENFFTETDRNRELRSAVLARRETHVSASYWGEDKSMFVSPLTGSRWTLITYRAKRLTRVLNVEAALLTIVLLMIGAAPYIALYIFTLIIAPRYRAPSVWPDETRRGDYLRLCVIYIALLILFGLTTYLLTPWSSFYAVMMIPAVAVLSTYLVLHRVGTPRRFAIAAALWIVANAVLFCVLLRYDVAPNPLFANHPAAPKALLLAVAVAVAALTAMTISSSSGRRLARAAVTRLPVRYSTLYRLSGVLLLILCAALPVAAFFNISSHVQSELMVKYGQLRAAADLEHRIDRIEKLSVLAENSDAVRTDAFRPDILEPLNSTWELRALIGKAPAAGIRVPCGGALTIPTGPANLLPALYEDSIAIRPLFGAGATDQLWQWCVEDDRITLLRRVRFDVDVSRKLWPETAANEQKIVITSLGKTAATPDDEDGGSQVPAMLLCGIGLLIVFWYAAGFIAKRVLLMDVAEPSWLARLPLSPSLGDHVFLVRRDRKAADLTGDDPLGKGLSFLDFSVEALAADDGWDDALERLDSSAAGRNVRIVDFEYDINDGALNLKKLKWLERLLSLPDRTVIVISTVSPAFVLTTPPPAENPPADYLDRWRALLDRFVMVTAEELELRNQEWLRRKEFRTLSQLRAGGPKGWLEKETAYNPFLHRLRDELDPRAERAELLDEISERAETYYAGLWASCRDDEKLQLYQLARNGLANGRNRRTLRRLIARGLVRRDPNISLFSETFRLYVLAAEQREHLVSRARAERGASTWDSLRLPFFVIIISFLLLLFATQKDLLTTTTALATALTTGLPIIMKLIGVFTEKRMGGPERA
jgi:hypothetical protein